MKKLLFIASFFVFVYFLAFGETKEQEVDYLLFSPNSGDTFIDEEQARIHLDNVAKYLMNRELIPGQIRVYGYAADVTNDIDPMVLSMTRAVFVINELEKRGLSKGLFAEPEGFGSVDLWGTDEDSRGFNRRVRIVLDGNILTPVVIGTIQEAIIAGVDEETVENTESGRGFPWHILLPLILALIAAILFWLFTLRKKTITKIIVKASAPAPVPVVVSERVVYLDDEIRYHAYMLSLQRNGQNGNMDGDWHQAVIEVGARYKTDGYQVYMADGYWWARQSSVQTMN